MSRDPMHVETDVLIIGSGAAGMYAAIEAARAGCDVLLVDRSLIGRGGATVMAQMTVAVALGSESPDHWSHHYDDTLEAGRGLCDERLARLLCEDGPECIRALDDLGCRLGTPGRRPHRAGVRARPRSSTLRLRGLPQYRPGGVEDAARRGHPRQEHPQGRRPRGGGSRVRRRRGHGRGGAACRERNAGYHRRQGDRRRHRRAHPALSTQQRLRQHGRRRLCPGAAGRRVAGRHGIRPVLPDRASRAASHRHGPDHVGSVPLQAGRAAAQQRGRGIHRPLRRQRGRALRHHPRRRDLRDREGGGGRTRLAPWRGLSQLPALLGDAVAPRLRPGDRPARAQRHRPHPHAGRGGADRALPHGRRGGRRAHDDRGARPAGCRRGGRRRQRGQPAFRKRHHRGAGVRPSRRTQRGRAREANGRPGLPAAGGARPRSIFSRTVQIATRSRRPS